MVEQTSTETQVTMRKIYTF